MDSILSEIEIYSHYEIIYAFFSYIFMYKIVKHYAVCEKKKTTIFYFITVLFLVIDFILYFYFPFKTEYGTARHLPNYIEYMLIIAIIVFMDYRNWAEKLYFSVFGYILVLMINLVIEANLALFYWGNIHTWFLIKCVLLFVVYFFIRKYTSEKGHYKAKDFKLFSLLAIIACMYIYGVSKFLPDLDFSDGISITYLSLCLILFLILVYSIFYIYLRMLGSRTKSLDEVAIQLDNQKMQKQILGEMKKANIENRKLRHDLKHHLYSLEYMLDVDPIKAKEYLRELNEHIEVVKVLISDNSILDYIINSKLAICREKHITFVYDIQDNLKQMTDFDLILLLSNALDNAIEAQDFVDKKYIQCDILKKKTTTIIHIENTYDRSKIQKKGDKFKSIKEDREQHGIGLERIKAIVSKYHGSIDIKTEEEFIIEIGIPKK